MPDERTALARFRALAMRDEALQETLARAGDAKSFLALARETAAAHGIDLDDSALRTLLRPDPLGLMRLTATPPIERSWPGRHWLPAHVATRDDAAMVDWAWFGPSPLRQPFFEGETRHAFSRPFNRVFGYRMHLDDVIAGAAAADCLHPSGFIFHMSRCGSTLVARMLAVPAENIVISEAPPIDAVLNLGQAATSQPQRQDAALSSIVKAYGRKRSGLERRYFIKLDCWHMLELARFRRVFPKVPWVFLYRDPVEVLVSQMSEPGSQMIPQLLPPGRFGIDEISPLPGINYSARVLNRICTAAADRYAEGGGMLVNYDELPGALFTRILPHFGVDADNAACAAMRAAARFDAKTPQTEFADDTDRKQRRATAELRSVAEQHLGDIYRRFEALRRRVQPVAHRTAHVAT